VGDPEQVLDPVGRFLAARIADGFMPGAAWCVASIARREPASRGALGLAALLPQAEPLEIVTPFDLASLTKPLATALLLVLLEQERRLDLDDPAARHLPELAGSPWAGTSLLSLAVHTSGLPAWEPLYLAGRDVVRSIAGRSPAAEPGRTLYSDLGYMLLGEVVARVAGESLDAAFRRRIAAPLGLLRTGFARDPRAFADAAATESDSVFERRMAGRAGEGHPWRIGVLRGEVHDGNASWLGGVAGHAGLFGPLDEVSALARELLEPERLDLAPRARDRLLATAPGADGRTVGFVAAGRSAAARGILPASAPGHTGFTGTSVWLDPPSGRLFVLLTNRVHPRVSPREFALVRRGFHRIASRLLAG
jgi:CubicO group peptidase (beta-lactamase class C family)